MSSHMDCGVCSQSSSSVRLISDEECHSYLASVHNRFRRFEKLNSLGKFILMIHMHDLLVHFESLSRSSQSESANDLFSDEECSASLENVFHQFNRFSKLNRNSKHQEFNASGKFKLARHMYDLLWKVHFESLSRSSNPNTNVHNINSKHVSVQPDESSPTFRSLLELIPSLTPASFYYSIPRLETASLIGLVSRLYPSPIYDSFTRASQLSATSNYTIDIYQSGLDETFT